MNDKGRAHPLKWYLYLLIAGSILPLTFFAAILVSRSAQSEREQAQARLERAAQGLAWTMDREFSGSMRTLNALAESEFLDNNRLLSFYNRARRVAHSQPTWQTVILVAPDGRQLINTSRPFGAKLDRVYETESLQKVLSTEQPAIGSLARGKRKILAFPIRVPVKRAGKIRYVLTAVITPEALVDVISAQSAAPYEWTRSIVDDKGILRRAPVIPRNSWEKRERPSICRRYAKGAKASFVISRLTDATFTSLTIASAIRDGPRPCPFLWRFLMLQATAPFLQW